MRLDELLEGSPLERAVLERPTARVPWTEWAKLCDRYCELVGGPEVVEAQSVELMLDSSLGGALAAVATTMAGPADYLRLVLTRVGPSLFRFIDWDLRTLPDGRIELTMRIDESLPGSVGWMAMARGGIPAIPMVIGAPAAACTGRLGPRGGVLTLTPPADNSLLRTVKRWFLFWRGAAAVSSELDFHQRALLETERSLLQSESTLRAMVDAFPDLLMLIDTDDTILRVQIGEDARRVQGIDGVEGRPLLEALEHSGMAGAPEVEAGLARLHRVRATRQAETFEYRRPSAGGDVIFDIRIVPHGARQIMVLARDLTRQRLLERQVAVAERMASMGQLAAGVAHEINNPLTVVAANLDALQRTLQTLLDRIPREVSADIVDLLAESRQGTDRISDVVRDLAQFSRVESLEMAAVDIAGIVRAATAMAKHDLRHRVDLQTEVAAELPLVLGDANRLVHVLVNLLVNAAQATETNDGSHVWLSVSYDARQREVVIVVEDDGPGLAPDVLPRIFDPFFTTKPPGEGTGLGLSVSRTAVTSMGGRITAANRPQGGARLELHLPEVDAETETPVASPEPERLKGLLILIVDDEPAVGRAVGRLLRGNEVVVASGAKHADSLLADGLMPDLVLCDLMMPDITGLAWYDSLAPEDPLRARILFMTGGAVTTQAQQFLERPDVSYLLKPFTPEALRDAAQRRLSERT